MVRFLAILIGIQLCPHGAFKQLVAVRDIKEERLTLAANLITCQLNIKVETARSQKAMGKTIASKM